MPGIRALPVFKKFWTSPSADLGADVESGGDSPTWMARRRPWPGGRGARTRLRDIDRSGDRFADRPSLAGRTSKESLIYSKVPPAMDGWPAKQSRQRLISRSRVRTPRPLGPSPRRPIDVDESPPDSTWAGKSVDGLVQPFLKKSARSVRSSSRESSESLNLLPPNRSLAVIDLRREPSQACQVRCCSTPSRDMRDQAALRALERAAPASYQLRLRFTM